MVDGLNLSENQQEVIEVLYETYDAAYRAKSEPLQEELKDSGRQIFESMVTPEMQDRIRQEFRRGFEEFQRMRESGNEMDQEQMRAAVAERMQALQTELQQMREESGDAKRIDKLLSELLRKIDAFRADKRQLREEFLSSARSQLDATQSADWPAIDRKLTRLKSLPKGRLSGESVDLLSIVEKLDLDEATRDKLMPTMVEYEGAIDLALRQRDERLASGESQLFRAVTQGKVNEATQIMDRQTNAHIAVRDLNDMYTNMMASSMNDALAKAFRQKVWSESFERLYRPTYTQQIIESIRAMEELDQAILLSVKEIESRFLVELDMVNQKVMAASRKQEPKELSRQAEQAADFFSGNLVDSMRGGPFGGRDENDPVEKAMSDRRDLDERYANQLKGLLREDQVALLPERRQRGGRGGFGGGGPGGGGWQNMSPEQQKEVLKRFDTNGDGQLDDTERQSMIESFRRQFRDRQEGQAG